MSFERRFRETNGDPAAAPPIEIVSALMQSRGLELVPRHSEYALTIAGAFP